MRGWLDCILSNYFKQYAGKSTHKRLWYVGKDGDKWSGFLAKQVFRESRTRCGVLLVGGTGFEPVTSTV